MTDLQTWLARTLPPSPRRPRWSSLGATTVSDSSRWFRCLPQRVPERRSREPAPVNKPACAPPGGVTDPGPASPSCPPPRTHGSSSPPRLLGPDDVRQGPLSPLGPPPSFRNSTFSLPSAETASPRSRHERGTRRRGNGESHPSASTRQQQTYRRSTAWPQAGFRGRRLHRHRRPARANERGSAEKAGATVQHASRTSEQDGPEPGHLMREACSA